MEFRLFPSLFDRPLRIKYSLQEEDEVIELFLRRHVVTNIPWILTVIIGIFIPPLAFNIDQALNTNVFTSISFQVFVGGLIVWYMLILAYAIESFLFWYFNVFIATNKHVIDIDYKSALSRETTEVQLEDVQSIRPDVKGIFGGLFNFGNLIIETAAENQNISFNSIPRPDFVADRVQDLAGARGHRTH